MSQEVEGLGLRPSGFVITANAWRAPGQREGEAEGCFSAAKKTGADSCGLVARGGCSHQCFQTRRSIDWPPDVFKILTQGSGHVQMQHLLRLWDAELLITPTLGV